MVARLMRRFPDTVMRYMERKSKNLSGCSSGSCENPIRRNSETLVRFLGARW